MTVWVVVQVHMEPAIMNVLTQMGMMIVVKIMIAHLLVKVMVSLLAGMDRVQKVKWSVLKLHVLIQIVVII